MLLLYPYDVSYKALIVTIIPCSKSDIGLKSGWWWYPEFICQTAASVQGTRVGSRWLGCLTPNIYATHFVDWRHFLVFFVWNQRECHLLQYCLNVLQRIYAEDLTYATGWKGFGHSLAGGMDLDSNTYPDLLVGSYESNKVLYKA